MNRDNIIRVSTHPGLDVFGESYRLLERRHIMIVNEEPFNASMEMTRIIAALTAQIINFVFPVVFLVKKLGHCLDRISIVAVNA